MKWGVLNINKSGGGYDTLQFIQIARNRGADGIWFVHEVRDEYETQLRKLKRISIPICEAMGLKYEVSHVPPESFCWPEPGKRYAHQLFSVKWMRDVREPFPLMPSQQALDKVNDVLKGRRPILVSLRNAPYQDARNSSVDWIRWAMDHEAFVLEDSCVTDMDVDERAAYYELSSLTVGTVCGQTSVVVYSRRPYLLLKALSRDYRPLSPDWWHRNGWSIGDQMPWADATQRFVWDYQDDYDSIEREFRSYMEANGSRLSV